MELPGSQLPAISHMGFVGRWLRHRSPLCPEEAEGPMAAVGVDSCPGTAAKTPRAGSCPSHILSVPWFCKRRKLPAWA